MRDIRHTIHGFTVDVVVTLIPGTEVVEVRSRVFNRAYLILAVDEVAAAELEE